MTSDRKIPFISVDDNPMMGDVMTMLTDIAPELDHAGHFLSGSGVLNKIQAEGIRLVVLDYEIPGTDTLSLLQNIKAASPLCRVLMLSAHARPEIVEACRRAGASGYAMKNHDPMKILEAVQRTAEGHSTFIASVLSKKIRSIKDSQMPFSIMDGWAAIAHFTQSTADYLKRTVHLRELSNL